MFAAVSPSSSRPRLAALRGGASDGVAASASGDAYDMSHDEVVAAPRGRDSHDDMSSVLDQIERRIEEVERDIASIAPLVHERSRLLRARALIRGEPEPALRGSALRPRITREDVFEHLTRNPGSRAGEIAVALNAGQGAVSAHLQRGKGRRFVCRAGRWYPVPAADVAAPVR